MRGVSLKSWASLSVTIWRVRGGTAIAAGVGVFPIPYYRQAFKTPTVRNSAVTAPFMHNGSFQTLKRVIEFSNKGGGKGLGLGVPEQTLDSAPLGLTDKEIGEIEGFLRALTDIRLDPAG